MIDSILIEAFMDNIERCYSLCDRKVPEPAVMRERALDFIANLKGIGFGDVRRLFDIARANFAPVPNLKNLSDSVPMLNGEKASLAIPRVSRIGYDKSTMSAEERAAWNVWMKQMTSALCRGAEKPYNVGAFGFDQHTGRIERKRYPDAPKPQASTLVKRINRREAAKMYAICIEKHEEYMSDPVAFFGAHEQEIRAVYDYDNAPAPAMNPALNPRNYRAVVGN